MLRFFSKIRYKLATENKAAKYIRYAIGEILLVVIGILIALQVNNWNEHRKQKIQEKNYLEQLLDDFEFNKSEAERNQLYSEFQRNNARLILKSFKEPLNKYESIKWFYALNHVWFLPHPSYNESSWGELKSTGHLELISNKEIVKSISTFYSNLDMINKLEDEWGNFNLEYRKEINNILELDVRQRFLENLNPTHIDDPATSAPDITPYLTKLKSKSEIKGLIDDIRINREVGAVYHVGLKNKIEEIIFLLQMEINHANK